MSYSLNNETKLHYLSWIIYVLTKHFIVDTRFYYRNKESVEPKRNERRTDPGGIEQTESKRTSKRIEPKVEPTKQGDRRTETKRSGTEQTETKRASSRTEKIN